MFRRYAITTLAALGILTSSASAATFYSDVPSAHWAAPAIQWASGLGYMTGPANKPGIFEPAGIVNRAQLAAVIWRHDQTLQKQINDLHVRLDLLERGEGRSSSRRSSSSSKTTAMSAVLMGSQEVPVVNTIATGYATFELDGDDLEYDITVDRLSSAITGAHFHRGAPGVSGPVIEPITFSGNRATGTWRNLTNTELADLLAGRLYVNVHTNSYPNGEIRGQVTIGTASSPSSRSSVSSSRSSSSSSSSLSSMSSSSFSSVSSSSSSFSSSSSSVSSI
jgi:hypothetical protein